jgi:hypothetical protein
VIAATTPKARKTDLARVDDFFVVFPVCRYLFFILDSPWGVICSKTQKPPTSMKTTYILGMDAAKHKIRVALCGAQGPLFEKDLPGSATAGGNERGFHFIPS